MVTFFFFSFQIVGCEKHPIYFIGIVSCRRSPLLIRLAYRFVANLRWVGSQNSSIRKKIWRFFGFQVYVFIGLWHCNYGIFSDVQYLRLWSFIYWSGEIQIIFTWITIFIILVGIFGIYYLKWILMKINWIKWISLEWTTSQCFVWSKLECFTHQTAAHDSYCHMQCSKWAKIYHGTTSNTEFRNNVRSK